MYVECTMSAVLVHWIREVVTYIYLETEFWFRLILLFRLVVVFVDALRKMKMNTRLKILQVCKNFFLSLSLTSLCFC